MFKFQLSFLKSVQTMERKRSNGFRRIFTQTNLKQQIKSYCENTAKPDSSFSFHDPIASL